MEKTLYDMMDWAGIEELVYSEASDPHHLLGAHETEHGVLVQVFIPTAEKVQDLLSSFRFLLIDLS